jgi:hypothetical protein
MNRKLLLEEMEVSIEELIQEAENLSEEEFETLQITGVWTAKEILSHMAAWDLFFLDVSGRLVTGKQLPEWPDFDTFNAREVSQRHNLDRDEIIDEVRRNRKAYIDFIATLSGQQLNTGSNFTVKTLAEDIMSHDEHHLQQMKAKKRR